MEVTEAILALCRTDPHDLTIRQLALLGHVARLDGGDSERALFHAIAADLGISKPAMTRAVSKLDGIGFVKRVPLPSDRRKFWVALTERGRRFVAESGLTRQTPQLYVLQLDGESDKPTLVGPFPTAAERRKWTRAAANRTPGGTVQFPVSTSPSLPVILPAAETARLKEGRRL